MQDVTSLLSGLAATEVIVGVYDKDENLVFANRAFRDTFLKGHPGGPIAFAGVLRWGFHHQLGVRIDCGDVEQFLRDILPRRRSVPQRSIETDTVDGRWLWITETLLPDGVLLSIGADITRLKSSEKSLRREHDKTVAVGEELRRRTEELTRSNAELEQFAAVASHDLQEPLRTVASYTQLLALRRDADPALVKEYSDFIVSGVRRMQSLIADLLVYSRVASAVTAPVPAALPDLLSQALLNLDGTLRGRGASVTFDELPVVMAHGPQIAQVLQNLIGNALKFCEGAPRVHIGAERRGLQWAISVRDNGIGIEPQHFAKLFMIFQRLNAREQYEGTGIGLALCKKIVERHGGRIWAESPGRGQGATFFFTLPAPPFPSGR